MSESTPRFISLNDTTSTLHVLDNSSRLEWGPTFNKKLNYAEAVDAVQRFNKSGDSRHADWRLPTRKELLSQVDDEKYMPACDKAAFPDMKPEGYWSSSPDASHPADFAWVVNFNYGDSDFAYRLNRFWVRPVRASQ